MSFQPNLNPETAHEALYDQHIAPLMAQVLELCREHEIPLIASFYLGATEAGPLFCTSGLYLERAPITMRLAAKTIYPEIDQ